MSQTLQQIKDEYARELGAEDFQDSKRHFELGIGISKLVDEFGFMEEVCRRYAAACSIKMGDQVITQEQFNVIYTQYSEMLSKADAQEWVAKEAQTFKESKEEYARRCCVATLEKTAENAKATSRAKYTRDEWGMNEHLVSEAHIQKASITNPDNIVIL